jgi:dsDNA-binding SOS-regulon protein
LSKFISQVDALNKKLSETITEELCLTMIWLEDTLQPSIDLMCLKALIYDMDSDIKLFEQKNGKSENTKKSAERVDKMIKLSEKLDKIATQNNTFQIMFKQYENRISWLNQINNELTTELEATKKAWEN